MIPEGVDRDRTLESLRVHDVPGALLLAVRHPGQDSFTFKPGGETPLEPGLTLIVMADADGHERLKRSVGRATGQYPPVRDS